VGLGEPTAAADKLILQLQGPAQFEFAGYYAASWRGFYAESGLTVEIRPTELDSTTKQPSVDAVREVAEGRAQFGTGTAELVIRAAQGQPLLLLAPIFQQSGAAVFYRADLDYPSPAALLKARVGRLPASDILDVELVTALRGEGVDPQRLRSVPIDQGQALSALNDRTVDAAVGSLWDLPYRAREKSIALKSFNPADYRVEFYGDTLFTVRRFAEAQRACLLPLDIETLPDTTKAQVNAVVAKRSDADLQKLRGSIDATPEVKSALEAKGLSSAQVIAASMGNDGALTSSHESPGILRGSYRDCPRVLTDS